MATQLSDSAINNANILQRFTS